MIILQPSDATKVRGKSPTVAYAALDPRVLKDGTFMLPEDVLTDPAHADVQAYLAALPKATVLAANVYQKGDTVPVEPTWQSAGVRQASVSVSTGSASIG